MSSYDKENKGTSEAHAESDFESESEGNRHCSSVAGRNRASLPTHCDGVELVQVSLYMTECAIQRESVRLHLDSSHQLPPF
jgi:hypothetical protein